MKRTRFKYVTKSLFASLLLMGVSANLAMAFESRGTEINRLCAAQGRVPAAPFNGRNCTLCHDRDRGFDGGSGAGRTAFQAPLNLDFFCELPPSNTSPTAAVIVETLAEGVPPVSNDLSVFANAFADTVPPGEDVFIGFNGADRGMGAGTGVDEMVPFSFKYPAFREIISATLKLELTPKSVLIRTDVLVFADLGNLTVGFGRDRLKDLTVNKKQWVTFNLRKIEKTVIDGGPIGDVDFSPYLLDGDLDVIYLDDAIIHKAILRVNGFVQDPVPPLIVE